MDSSTPTLLLLSFRPNESIFMETDWPLRRRPHLDLACLKSPAPRSGAVNHSDAETEGRFADNTDPFEVKVGRPPVP